MYLRWHVLLCPKVYVPWILWSRATVLSCSCRCHNSPQALSRVPHATTSVEISDNVAHCWSEGESMGIFWQNRFHHCHVNWRSGTNGTRMRVLVNIIFYILRTCNVTHWPCLWTITVSLAEYFSVSVSWHARAVLISLITKLWLWTCLNWLINNECIDARRWHCGLLASRMLSRANNALAKVLCRWCSNIQERSE